MGFFFWTCGIAKALDTRLIRHAMGKLPITCPISPKKLLDGDLLWLDAKSLEPMCEPANPFPGSVMHTAIVKEGFASTWIDHELRTARMAALPLNENFLQGIKKDELRDIQRIGQTIPHVSGAIWSHMLDAEPLASCSHDGGLIFGLWKRGVYRILEGEIDWSAPMPDWNSKKSLPRDDEMITLENNNGRIYAWSKTGLWAEIDPFNGGIIDTGSIDLPGWLDCIFINENGHRIISCESQGSLFVETLDSKPIVLSLPGPIGDAIFEDGIWRITGWRYDLILDGDSVEISEREELGIGIHKHEEKWLVLDNLGQWSEHCHTN